MVIIKDFLENKRIKTLVLVNNVLLGSSYCPDALLHNSGSQLLLFYSFGAIILSFALFLAF